MKLAVSNQAIANWPPGAALWLVWEMADPAGKAQGLAIDNFSFSATAPLTASNALSLTIQTGSAQQFVLSWRSLPSGYQLYSASDLTPPISWNVVTALGAVSNGETSLALRATNAVQFFRLIAR
jgi:hypothetical protein